MPEDQRLYPTIGNGHIATAVYSDTIYMNGFYNGYAYGSHRARIPSPCAIKIRDVSEKIIQNEYALKLEQGKVCTLFFLLLGKTRISLLLTMGK